MRAQRALGVRPEEGGDHLGFEFAHVAPEFVLRRLREAREVLGKTHPAIHAHIKGDLQLTAGGRHHAAARRHRQHAQIFVAGFGIRPGQTRHGIGRRDLKDVTGAHALQV